MNQDRATRNAQRRANLTGRPAIVYRHLGPVTQQEERQGHQNYYVADVATSDVNVVVICDPDPPCPVARCVKRGAHRKHEGRDGAGRFYMDDAGNVL